MRPKLPHCHSVLSVFLQYTIKYLILLRFQCQNSANSTVQCKSALFFHSVIDLYFMNFAILSPYENTLDLQTLDLYVKICMAIKKATYIRDHFFNKQTKNYNGSLV